MLIRALLSLSVLFGSTVRTLLSVGMAMYTAVYVTTVIGTVHGTVVSVRQLKQTVMDSVVIMTESVLL
jgi:hypothetical protein